MKVLYILENDISIDNGAGINERNFIRDLLNADIHVWITRPKYEIDNEIFNNEKIHISKRKINRKNPYAYSIYLINKIRQINQITKEHNVDTLVFRWGSIPIDIILFGLFTKKKVFLKQMTFLSTTQKDDFAFNIVRFFRRLVVLSKVVEGCDTPSLVTSKLVKHDYRIDNVIVVKNGVEEIYYDKVKKNKDFIYIGMLSEKRNTNVLLQVFKDSKRSIDIYGFGDMVEDVKLYASKYKNINYCGYISYEDLKKELPKYKFGIDFTYIQTKYGKASFSQKIAQYLWYKLNVLAIDCEDNKFIEENNVGMLFDIERDNLHEIVDDIEYNEININKIKKYISNQEFLKQRIKFWKSVSDN